MNRYPPRGSYLHNRSVQNDEIISSLRGLNINASMPTAPQRYAPTRRDNPSTSRSVNSSTFQYLQKAGESRRAFRTPTSARNKYLVSTGSLNTEPGVPVPEPILRTTIDAGPWKMASKRNVHAGYLKTTGRYRSPERIRSNKNQEPTREEKVASFHVDAAASGLSDNPAVPPWKLESFDEEEEEEEIPDMSDFSIGGSWGEHRPSDWRHGVREAHPLPPTSLPHSDSSTPGLRTLSAIINHGSDLVLDRAKHLSDTILERHARLNELCARNFTSSAVL